jgi:hypothetical protein
VPVQPDDEAVADAAAGVRSETMTMTMKNLGLACCLAFLALQANSVHAQPGLEKQVAIQKVDDLQPIIQDLSMELWNFSEIALEEVRSAQLLADVLEKEGFSVERLGPGRSGHRHPRRVRRTAQYR